MEPQTGNYIVFLFFILLIILNLRGEDAGRDELKRIIEETRNLTETLHNETYNSDNIKILPNPMKNNIYDLLGQDNKKVHGRYYQNITSTFRGEWHGEEVEFHHSEHVKLNESDRGRFLFNSSGNAILSLSSYPTENNTVAFIEGGIRLDNRRESDRGVFFYLEGLHYQKNGTVFLVGTPNNTAEASNITSLMLNENMFNNTKSVLLGIYQKRMDDLENRLKAGQGIQPIQDQLITEETRCTLRMYLQLKPIPLDIALNDVLEYEKELQHPTGVPVMSSPPPLEANILTYSTNCGIEITAKKMNGLLVAEFYNRVTLLSILATIVGVVQLFLIISQMEYTQTPAGITKIAYWTITLQCVMDGFICIGLLTAALVLHKVFLPVLVAAFFSLVLMTIYEVRYWGVIRRIQQLSSDSDRDYRAAYVQFYISAICALIIYWLAGAQSVAYQEVVLGIGFFIAHSSWWPQAWRNIRRGTRKPFQKRFLFGMTITRLVYPFYIFGCPDNLVYHRASPWIWALIGYNALQIIVLCIQDKFGPRFLVPQRFLPEIYDYHPIMPSSDDVEAAAEPRDCCICMRPVEAVSSDGAPGARLARNAYMLTPCDHLFHTACLEQWMRIKMECPACRSALPPA
ncbi:hypothetical protein BDF19DRAFT_467909 [Syncephalis fuscata]|nr:hypothetical protein BDF19DRAFT_467909 [Syncephalis fuscata]